MCIGKIFKRNLQDVLHEGESIDIRWQRVKEVVKLTYHEVLGPTKHTKMDLDTEIEEERVAMKAAVNDSCTRTVKAVTQIN